MDFFHQVWDIIANLQDHLEEWTGRYGALIYLILFLIIFCETGLVVMPFLPGDSLLFAAGALCAPSVGKLNLLILGALLPLAAILGDNLNYWIGRFLGPKVFKRQKSLFFNTEILHKTQAFYAKHGRKMVVLARFVPLVRTFAPFVAGVGKMHYGVFLSYGLIGAFLWVWICAGAGYFLGNLPWVKEHFEIIVLGVIAISLLPAVLGWISAVRQAKLEQRDAAEE
ncbi:MAG: DedA family protein [Verrucomicrobiales bacterium]|nr:DedA family protein [Verrucomicrobiales bacterium]